MENTILFIFQLIRDFRVNIGHTLPMKPLQSHLMKASPIIQNNIENAFNQLIDRGVLRDKNGNLFLTEQGFNEVYNQ